MRRNPRQLPALWAEVAAAAALATPALYPAFFFVLEKAVQSAGNAVIPTFPTHWSHGLQHLRHKRPTFAFTSESGYTLGFRRKIAHNGSHAETGAFRTGVVSLPSERFTRFGNPAWPGGRTANFAAFGAWPWVLPKNAESLRDSDALMRVAVPRRRGPAGLRDLFRFCRNCGLYTLFQIFFSILQTLQLVLFLCKLRLSSFLFGSELFKELWFCHCD